MATKLQEFDVQRSQCLDWSASRVRRTNHMPVLDDFCANVYNFSIYFGYTELFFFVNYLYSLLNIFRFYFIDNKVIRSGTALEIISKIQENGSFSIDTYFFLRWDLNYIVRYNLLWFYFFSGVTITHLFYSTAKAMNLDEFCCTLDQLLHFATMILYKFLR